MIVNMWITREHKVKVETNSDGNDSNTRTQSESNSDGNDS